MRSKPVKIIAINGSIRDGNYTGKALKILLDRLREQKNVTVEVVNPSELRLPFPGGEGSEEAAALLEKIVKDATGVVLATPEYNGSFSSVTKAVIENLGYPSVLLGKPVVLLGVAAGRIGAIKALEHLQSVCFHIGAIVIPGPVSIPDIFEVFDKEGNCRDPKVKEQIEGLASNLLDFIRNHVTPAMASEELSREDA